MREIGFWLERSRAQTHRVQAYRRAARVLEGLPDAELDRHRAHGTWQELAGIGPKTAAVIEEACSGVVPHYLAELRAAATPVGPEGAPLRSLLRGDLHTHSDWSDGGSPIAEMMGCAAALGHEYCALTDHSPRLTIANGLSAQRLRRQLDVVAELNAQLAPFRILTGIEVDILDDGALDQDADLLAELDIVVASVHSRLRDDSETMTRRMVYAVANPHVDVLGHCTGRLVTGGRGTRPESQFDAEVVFEACRVYGTAVEINSRPERRDPPSRLIRLAAGMGCEFALDTDAHAPGQLDWQGYGCARALANGVAPERVINTRPVDELLEWTRSGPS
ncbi:PHP domain-containing protein [Nocardia donostiensis]|uniref:PHP domain-containing protein n=1 Tax=Nocardia donostiensis TaxID=1538463 RepID=A0A1V2TIJ1_9NOCA|nr:PHP domain-containing protein [Nocardia donostiensis]OQS14855.1 PHP domain-containing protein [Nocardia donostiensis]OQS21858.1 PHP domain-containing protein [Nocardia donostiensis]